MCKKKKERFRLKVKIYHTEKPISFGSQMTTIKGYLFCRDAPSVSRFCRDTTHVHWVTTDSDKLNKCTVYDLII